MASVIELAIICIENDQIVEKQEFLIKPAYVLSSREIKKTGYTNEELRQQPAFVEIAQQIVDMIANSNVYYFDLFSERIFRRHFREIGFPLPKSPYIIQQSLGTLDNRNKNISLKKAISTALKTTIEPTAIGKCLGMVSLLDYLNTGEMDVGDNAFAKAYSSKIHQYIQEVADLPTTPGVYYFKDSLGTIIYVGKAINIKKRVISHLKSKVPFEVHLSSEIHTIEFKETGNELIALLLETQEIGTYQPEYNTQQKEEINPWIISSRKDKKGVIRVMPIERVYDDMENTFFYNKTSVLLMVKELKIKYNLCPRFIGLERSAASCSDSKCLGICRGEEDVSDYNLRAGTALKSLMKTVESFYINLKGRNSMERAFVIVKEGLYLGYGFVSNNEHVNSIEDLESFLITQEHNYYSSRSIDQYLKKKGKEKMYF